jgi:hypothetical protein
MECSSSTGIVDSCPVEENVRSNLDFHVKQGSEIWLVSSLDIVAREYLILNWRIIYTYIHTYIHVCFFTYYMYDQIEMYV